MIGKKLTKLEEFQQGDVIRVELFTSDCQLDETTFVAIVIDTKKDGVIAIPQDFRAWRYSANKKGASWIIEINHLLDTYVEIILLERYDY